MVYVRTLGSKEFTFQVSGMLWRNSLVMIDRESGTWWSHVTGRAIKGKNSGSQLQKLESVETSWSEWRAAHPDTEPLAKSEAFKAFQAGLKDRCEEPPNPVDLELVGAYGFFE